MPLNITEEESLWESLHEGTLESLTSDLLARSVTLTVDVPYLWEFHNFASDTRFQITLDNVSLVEALEFRAWPGALEIPGGLLWEEQERMRRAYFDKGRSQSVSWEVLASKLQHTDDYDIQNARLLPDADSKTQLRIDVMNQVAHDYPEIRLTAENVRFWMTPGSRELPLKEFIALGRGYWEDFGRGAGPKPSTN